MGVNRGCDFQSRKQELHTAQTLVKVSPSASRASVASTRTGDGGDVLWCKCIFSTTLREALLSLRSPQ